ncbi:MAG: GNAT family N-acetyltransferase [Anaerolineae bacterium]|nr:GNAT family N-acetyltransferase [Anaerolineae bacterium]
MAFTIRPGVLDDLPRFADLDGRVFAGPGRSYDMLYDLVANHLPNMPGFKPEYLRLGMVDGELAAQAQIVPFTMSYGRAALNVGGIASVATDAAHRGKGYATAMMRDGIRYLEAHKFDISLLGSIPANFYNRMGYANVWPNYRLRVAPRDVDTLSADRLGGALPVVEVRELTPDDYPAALALYDQHWGKRYGAHIRSLDYLTWRLGRVFIYKRAAFDGSGRLRGYMLSHRHNPVIEVVSSDAETTAALLRESVAAIMAHETDAEAREQPFTWGVPPDSPVVRHVRALCPVSICTECYPNKGWMGRIIDLRSTIEHLLPELQARIQDSPYARWAGRLRIETDIGQATVAFSQGRLALGRHVRDSLVTRLSQTDLIQLIFSYVTPAEVAARQGVHFDAQTTGLLEALFPPVVADLGGVDWF